MVDVGDDSNVSEICHWSFKRLFCEWLKGKSAKKNCEILSAAKYESKTNCQLRKQEFSGFFEVNFFKK